MAELPHACGHLSQKACMPSIVPQACFFEYGIAGHACGTLRTNRAFQCFEKNARLIFFDFFCEVLFLYISFRLLCLFCIFILVLIFLKQIRRN